MLLSLSVVQMKKLLCKDLLPLFPIASSSKLKPYKVPASVSYYEDILHDALESEIHQQTLTGYISFKVPDDYFPVTKCIGIIRGLKHDLGKANSIHDPIEAALLCIPDGHHYMDLSLYKFYQYIQKSVFQVMGYCRLMAEGAAETLKFNMALILLPVCRNTITCLRSAKLSSFIPFDDNINFHKTVVAAIVTGIILHASNYLVCDFPKLIRANSIGNKKVRKIVLAAAAKHLTLVVLELGGKSPVFMDSNINFKLDAMKHELKKFYGKDPLNSGDLYHIVNANHFYGLSNLLNDTKVIDKVVHGAQRDENNLKIAPTILLNVPHDSLIMKEEIFSPLLPIITVRHALPVKIDLSLYNLFLDNKRFADNDSHTFMNYNNNMPSVISEVGSGEGSMTCLLYNLFLDNKRFANNDGHTFMNYNNNMSSVISQMGSGEDSVYATLLLTYEG
ncbi:Respiratory burst oxidase -like protein A [Capsicum chinense]|nr:Respiratory burst oxidase -like protein A [Capsicum chinense]